MKRLRLPSGIGTAEGAAEAVASSRAEIHSARQVEKHLAGEVSVVYMTREGEIRTFGANDISPGDVSRSEEAALRHSARARALVEIGRLTRDELITARQAEDDYGAMKRQGVSVPSPAERQFEWHPGRVYVIPDDVAEKLTGAGYAECVEELSPDAA